MADQCRSCHAPILWLANTTTGKFAPIDRDPDPDGNIVVLNQGQYQVLSPTGRLDARAEGFVLYKNHFVTCAQADSWSKH